MEHYGDRYFWDRALAASTSFNAFIRGQKRKRWCRHLQRSCGTKQIWEILAFTGRFDLQTLEAALTRENTQDGLAEEDTQGADHERRLLLKERKAKAKARLNEGQRLARQRNALRARSSGACQPALTRWQTWLLEQYDTGALQQDYNEAIAKHGHGCLRDEAGRFMKIGGSTGGWSRCVIDGWEKPGCEEFLQDSAAMVNILQLRCRPGT